MTTNIKEVHKASYLRPSLTGGSPAPLGFNWVVYSLPQHHITVLDTLARTKTSSTHRALRLIIDSYLIEHRDEVDAAFLELKEQKQNAAKRVNHE